MSEEDLDLLMLQLLRAQAYRRRSPVNEIRVNTECKAKDGGVRWLVRNSDDYGSLARLGQHSQITREKAACGS
jgi:hypothetical protein